jgi:hypothetical protein
MSQQQTDLRGRILDKALEQAEASSWERLHLYAVAGALHIGLDEILYYFPQKDDMVEGWFDRADRAMLGVDRGPDFPDLPLQERLQQVICSWLDALASHHRLTRDEAARQDSTGLQRILEESILTSIYLAAFARWLCDDAGKGSEGKAFLETALRRWLGGGHVVGKQSAAPEGTATAPQQPSN